MAQPCNPSAQHSVQPSLYAHKELLNKNLMIERTIMGDMLIFCAKVACHFYRKDKREEIKTQIYATSLTLTILCGKALAQGTECFPTTRILLKYRLEKKICKLLHQILQTLDPTRALTRKLIDLVYSLMTDCLNSPQINMALMPNNTSRKIKIIHQYTTLTHRRLIFVKIQKQYHR